MIDYLFGSFPREVSIPRRRLVETWSAFMRHVNAANGFVPVFASIYRFPAYPNYNSAVIDKVAFDFDGLSTWYAVRRLHLAAEQRGWEHCFIFSGGGYHGYIRADPVHLDYPKSALRRFQDAITKGLAVPFDKTLRGDVSQCMRVPGTWNHRRGRFCYALLRERIDDPTPHTAVNDGAKQHFNTPEQCVFEGKAVNLKPYDAPLDEYADLELSEVDAGEAVEVVIHDSYIAALVTPDMGHQARARVIFWLVKEGYTLTEITGFLEQALNEAKYKHCVYFERQPQRIMEGYG